MIREHERRRADGNAGDLFIVPGLRWIEQHNLRRCTEPLRVPLRRLRDFLCQFALAIAVIPDEKHGASSVPLGDSAARSIPEHAFVLQVVYCTRKMYVLGF